MSTIKSSDEHLTLNADGSSKDIKFQANGVEKASISSAGAFTSTTIDATKLTGNLPAINGASLTGVADATKLPLAGGTITGLLKVYPSNGQMRLSDNQETKYAELEASNGRLFLHSDKSNAEADTDMRFYIDNSEKIRINANGALLIAATDQASTEKQRIDFSGNAENGIRINSNTTNTSSAIQLANDANGVVGTINTSGSSTAYNTSSDYRLKENVDYTWDATTRLKQLKPARFNFIADDTNTLVDGFIAHEVSSIVPEAVSGEKDATETYTDNEGNEQTRIVSQGIDQSKLVPLLVKTIQELEARITALEA